ncbi:hypothetical protein ILUMI_21972 [Ignelater luminosus]|uniref:Cyclic nucleotide-binding domain-containing protein n=1 Tax=Ignelater luminosus TaxID=2038154 RepID=A0A8K0FXL6_IGNLU|nr:hypothetical protein ILUMI_21972 [Ignelater luminosus]
MVVAILYPYQISFARQFPKSMTLIRVVIDGVYLIDIILQIFTAVEDENGIISNVSDIFPVRCRKLSFIFDVIAITPIISIARFFHITENERIIIIFTMPRLFKFHRVIMLFKKLNASFDVNIAMVRCIKYVLYFLLLSYFMGAIFYMLACFYEECTENSWYDWIKKEDDEVKATRHNRSFPLSIYFGALVIAQAGFGDITPHTIIELCFTMVFFIFGTLLFCYLVADYSATLMLAERAKLNYIEMVTVVKKYLAYNQMLMSIQSRTNEYLALQWHINMGYNIIKEQSVLFDAPRHLFEEQQTVKYFHVLTKVPLFKEMEGQYIKRIAAEVKQIFLPPYETVAYAGEVVRDMYLIDRGFCEIISAASGKTEKVIGPSSHFCDFDMILERPGIHHIRTVTCVRILKISYTAIKKVFVEADLFEELNKQANEVKSSLAVQRLFFRRGHVTYQSMKEEQRKSWYVFPRRKLHPSSIDYEKAFDKLGFWRFFRAFLLRRTIMPDGDFLLVWETIQGIRIFIMGMYYVSLIFVQAYIRYTEFVWILFDLLGFIDLYIRMHVCYYNDKGILVTHPKYTARHYLSRAFIVDLCSLLPTPLFLKLVLSAKGKEQRSTLYRIESLFRMNKLVQVYRLLGIFSYFEGDILRSGGILLNVVKFLPISILFFNALAALIVTMTCMFSMTEHGFSEIIPNPSSWIAVNKDKRRFNITVPINLYVSAYYLSVVTGLQEGYGNFKPWQVSEMYFIIAAMVAGYLLFTYILVVISSSKARLNVNLTLYQEHMKHLIQFMKREKINKDLQKKVIDHFEYIWQRTHGMKASNILKKCHQALRKDSVLYLYEQTLMLVPIFTDMSKPFYRTFGMHLEEAYFLRYSSIIKLNDIIDTIYIIHKGEVTVIAPDGSTFAVLTRGCVFGNIDNANDSRSMTSVVASKAVDLLFISTEKLYDLAVDYPVVLNRLRRHILIDNLSYIEKKSKRESFQFEQVGSKMLSELRQSSKRILLERRIRGLLLTSLLPLPMMLISFASCFIIMYHLAFQNHTTMVFIITYSLDLVHLIKIYAGFYIPYVNHMGEIITDTKKIRRKFLTLTRFYLELFALLPFDIFAIAAPKTKSLYYLTWLRINRMLRMWNIYHFFNVTFDRLNINVLIIKLGSVVIYFVLMVHIGTCMLYMAACPEGKCDTKSWIYFDDGTIRDNNHYLISVYFMITMLSCTGFGDVAAGTVPEMIVCIVIMLLGKFIMAVFIGDISAMVQNYSYTLITYDYNMTTLIEYLHRSYIAGPLITRIKNYFNHLWKKDRGLQLPVLLEEAPNYLLEDVKAAAYGKHFYDNYIFVACHVDFLRQLIAKVKAQTFFQGDTICQQGDVNNMMYFIHKGIVNMYMIEGSDEIQVEQLHALDCFGLVQGLIASTPHTHTYKAETVAVILTLELFDWVHLLRYYRAARYEIYTRLKKMSETRKRTEVVT